ncbi:unnamed protein product [Polarella glacialis]|uniref:Uncharacterized protein n=1 Tax=Polarella glacialis TaxID=89957 RepID=A0A813LCE1_POLGL|nr:unnamed protein product [Polarella glacialis]
MDADKVVMSGVFIAGEVECGGGRNAISDQIAEDLKTGCFVQDAAYAPIVPQVQLYAVDAYECQRLLRNSTFGDFFVYYSMVGLCDFVVAAGSIESFSKGAVSGEKSCAQTEVVVVEKDDAEVPQFGPRASAPFGVSGLVMLAGTLAAVAGLSLGARRRAGQVGSGRAFEMGGSHEESGSYEHANREKNHP